MTRRYTLERTDFIGCQNTSYMDVDDAEPCPFCGSRTVTIYPYGQGTTSYVEGVPTLYLFICHLQMPRLHRRDRRSPAQIDYRGRGRIQRLYRSPQDLEYPI